MLEKVSFNYKNKGFEIGVKNCNLFEKFFGLMFVRRRKAQALLFEFRKPTTMRIHSYFVFFPFIAVWLDDKNKVIEVKKIKPFTFSVSERKSYSKLIEIPINKEYISFTKLLVGG